MIDSYDIVASLELALILIAFLLGFTVGVAIAAALGTDDMGVCLVAGGIAGTIATYLYLKWVGKTTSKDKETD